jgi:uncharacterized membrane protein
MDEPRRDEHDASTPQRPRREILLEQVGTHAMGATAGAIGGAVAGAVIGIAAGPVGSLAGAVGGAVAGGLLGSGAIGSTVAGAPLTKINETETEAETGTKTER